MIIKVNKLFSFFSSLCFLKEIKNMYSVFLSSYRNTRESLGELEKAVETLACGSCSHSISRSLKLSLVFLYLDRNTVHVFYFLNIDKEKLQSIMRQSCKNIKSYKIKNTYRYKVVY